MPSSIVAAAERRGECGRLFAVAELGVFEKEELLAVAVEADAGLHVGIAAGEFKDFAGAEADRDARGPRHRG